MYMYLGEYISGIQRAEKGIRVAGPGVRDNCEP